MRSPLTCVGPNSLHFAPRPAPSLGLLCNMGPKTLQSAPPPPPTPLPLPCSIGPKSLLSPPRNPPISVNWIQPPPPPSPPPPAPPPSHEHVTAPRILLNTYIVFSQHTLFTTWMNSPTQTLHPPPPPPHTHTHTHTRTPLHPDFRFNRQWQGSVHFLQQASGEM